MDEAMRSMEAVVSAAPAPIERNRLKTLLLERGVDDADIRAAFWFLVDQGRIHWLDDGRVQVRGE